MPKEEETEEESEESEDEETETEEVEESGLEEDLNLNLRDLEFHQFMDSSEISGEGAPVLERMALQAERPVFVGGIPQTTSGTSRDSDGNDFKYLDSSSGGDEAKYIESDSRISSEPIYLDTAQAGRRQTSSEVNQRALIEGASEQRNTSSETVERFERPDRIDVERAGRKNPFEREDTKYEKYKPSSY